MAFRGDMPFGLIMLELQGFSQSPLYMLYILDGGRARGISGASTAGWNTGRYCRAGGVVLA
jgi:hypothetical protein